MQPTRANCWVMRSASRIRGINRVGTEMPTAEAALGRAMVAERQRVEQLGEK